MQGKRTRNRYDLAGPGCEGKLVPGSVTRYFHEPEPSTAERNPTSFLPWRLSYLAAKA